jgi:diacylglycerol kinase family enzyme
MHGIGLISNPFSKKNRKNPDRIEMMKNLLPDSSLAKFPSSFDELDNAMKFFKKREIEILAINGGDGTVHVALTSMMKIYKDSKLPKIAILKGGTMNQTATSLRIKGNNVEILKRIIKKYNSQTELKVKRIPLLNINNKYGFIFGNGAVCTFMDFYHESPDPSPLVAAKTAVKLIFSMIFKGKLYRKLFSPTRMEIISDGSSFGKKAYLATLISTIKEIGLGFKLMQRANENQKVHAIAFHDNPKIVPYVFRLWRGKSIPPFSADDIVGREFFIHSKKPFKYTIDGDMYNSSGKLYIKAEPIISIVTE